MATLNFSSINLSKVNPSYDYEAAKAELQKAVDAGWKLAVTPYTDTKGNAAIAVETAKSTEYKVRMGTTSFTNLVYYGAGQRVGDLFKDEEATEYQSEDFGLEVFKSLAEAGAPMKMRPLFVGKDTKVVISVLLPRVTFKFRLDRTEEVMNLLKDLNLA